MRSVLFYKGRASGFSEQESPAKEQDIILFIKTALKKAVSVQGIGLGIAGTLDKKLGRVLRSPNISWMDGFQAVSVLSREFKLPVLIDNDARCFLRSEAKIGSAQNLKSALAVTLGSGIGGAVMIDGRIIEGANFSAGEIGHMRFDENLEWEEMASKKVFLRMGHSAEEVAKEIRRGSDHARKIFEKIGHNLGLGIANLINVLDPEAVVLGGGGAKYANLFLPALKETSAKYIINPKAKTVKIIRTKLGDKAGAIGAAMLFSGDNL